MPFPNEHSCRLADPDTVKVVGSIMRDHEGKSYRILVGKRKGSNASEKQAYRYPKSEWTAEAARKHCEDAGGSFEAAAKGAQEMNPEFYLDPLNNPMIPGSDEEEAEFMRSQKEGEKPK